MKQLNQIAVKAALGLLASEQQTTKNMARVQKVKEYTHKGIRVCKTATISTKRIKK